MGYHVYFRLQATFFYKGAEPAWLHKAQELELKE